MGNSWQILPSPRPLLLWLGADAVCVALLTLLALGLLALWRRPARPWRLGLASLAASWLGIAVALRVYRAYRDIAPLADGCSTPYDCAVTSQAITDTVIWAGFLSAALVTVTLAALLAATILSALERRGQPAAPEVDADGAAGWRGRMAVLATLDLLTALGVLLTAQGVFDWILFAPLLDPQRSGDGLGLLPLIDAIFTTVGGAILMLLAGFSLLSVIMPGPAFLWRRRLPRSADDVTP